MEKLDVIVVGAGGFGGIHMLYSLQKSGFSVLGFEAAPSAGGAWYWNRYPGARCDSESLCYSFTFSQEIDQEWRWSERYASQPEILKYLQFCCDRLGLKSLIHFNNRVIKLIYNEIEEEWIVTTNQGTDYVASHVVSAVGPITKAIWPNLAGRNLYRGRLVHTAEWPEDSVSFEGRRVGVIGTGSSGTQVIPLIATEADQLSVFLRTPNYYVPAKNRELTSDDHRAWEKCRGSIREGLRSGRVFGSGDTFMSEELRNSFTKAGSTYSVSEQIEILEKRWRHGGATAPRAFSDYVTDRSTNALISDFLRKKISEAVTNPETAEILTPRFPFGAKRTCVGTNYLETFNRENVRLIDVKNKPISGFYEKGLLVGGEEYELDTIICATGFDALTGAINDIEIRGKRGQLLSEAWTKSCTNYLGISVAGFPNFHIIGGPGSLSVLVNVPTANEFQVNWIVKLLKFLRTNNKNYVEISKESQVWWREQLDNAFLGTVLTEGNSWYIGANVEGKPLEILAYAGGLSKYIMHCNNEESNKYQSYSIH